MDISHAVHKRLKEGDIFYVFYDYIGKYLFGKVLLDVKNRILKNEDIDKFRFFSNCYLIGIYNGIYDNPILETNEFIIPSMYVLKGAFSGKNKCIDWHFYCNETIDYSKLTFPETLISYNNEIYFRAGGLYIKTPLTHKDYAKDFAIHGAVYFDLVLCDVVHYMKRDDLFPTKIDVKIRIGDNDLRFLPEKREKLFSLMNENPNLSQYELSLKYGFDISRFY